MRANKEAKKRVKAEQSAIRYLLNDWDPIWGSPEDEYDCLVEHIISALYRGHSSADAIASIITSELNEHFGITEPEAEIAKVADSIARYWKDHLGDLLHPGSAQQET